MCLMSESFVVLALFDSKRQNHDFKQYKSMEHLGKIHYEHYKDLICKYRILFSLSIRLRLHLIIVPYE